MAKIKKQVIISKFGIALGGGGKHVLQVWADDIVVQEVKTIEGISDVIIHTQSPVTVCVDPRYDVDEVIAELDELLSAKIPDVFYDDPQ